MYFKKDEKAEDLHWNSNSENKEEGIHWRETTELEGLLDLAKILICGQARRNNSW